MKRLPDESFEDYKKRRAADERETRRKLRGTLFWKSSVWGTYHKKKESAGGKARATGGRLSSMSTGK